MSDSTNAADEACPLPKRPDQSEADMIRRMLAATRIAIVGLSDDPSRPSQGVAAYLQSVGKAIIPINPNCRRVLGLPCWESLPAAPGPIDVVNVFRRPEHCPDIVRAAIAAGATGVWLQTGIRNQAARQIAREAGLDYVEDRCMKVDLMFHNQ